jgi:hypothetical protein
MGTPGVRANAVILTVYGSRAKPILVLIHGETESLTLRAIAY